MSIATKRRPPLTALSETRPIPIPVYWSSPRVRLTKILPSRSSTRNGNTVTSGESAGSFRVAEHGSLTRHIPFLVVVDSVLPLIEGYCSCTLTLSDNSTGESYWPRPGDDRLLMRSTCIALQKVNKRYPDPTFKWTRTTKRHISHAITKLQSVSLVSFILQANSIIDSRL